MEIEGCQEFDLELEGHDLIDIDQFPETVDAKKVDYSLGIDVADNLPELCESKEPERNQRNGRYNLRKSLAWDSAFFTSAGVLDAEELSSMITGSDKKKKHALPGIQEEISGSTESISTLQSDTLTLENLDDDLFLDIRASIQRSSKKPSSSIYSSTKIAPMELVEGSALSSPKKDDFVSQNKNPKPGVKKTSGLQNARMSKSQLKPTGKPSGRPMKLDSAQSQIGSIHKTGETNSVLPRPLKTISSSVPSTAPKQLSVGTGRVKPECGSSKQGSISCKGAQLPNVSALGGSRKMLPKAAVSLKSSSLVSSTTSNVNSTRSSTSSDNSIKTSSGNAPKPTLMTARRNLVKNNNISTGSSGSIPNSPSRAVPKKKLPAPTLSSYLKSTKISVSVSPASSISEWSSASSTASCAVNQRSNYLRTSLDTGSCRSGDGDKFHLDPRNIPAGQKKAERLGNQGVIFTSGTSKKSSKESGILQAPAKPSGLRLPSPKIGFFDGKSLSRTPNGQQRSQPSLHPGLPKNGTAASTPTRSSNGKLKSAKAPTSRMGSSSASIKSSSPKAASLASSQVKLLSLEEIPTVSIDINDLSTLSLGVRGSRTGETSEVTVETETENGDKKVMDESTGAVDKVNSGDSSLHKSMSSGDVETAAGERNFTTGTGLEDISKASTPTQSLNGELKSPKVPSARMTTSLANIKSASSKASSSAFPREKPHALVNASCVSVDVNDSSILSLEVKGSKTGETCRKAIDVPTGNGDEQVADAGTNAVDEGNFGDLSLSKSINSVDIETLDGKGCYSSGSECIVSQTGDGMLINRNTVPTSEAIEKENDPATCQGEGLTECALSSTAAACIPPFDNPAELVIQVAGTGVSKDNSCDKNIKSGDDIEKAAGEGSSYNSGSENIEDSMLINKNWVAMEKENDPANCQGHGLTGGKKEKNHELECAATCRPPFALKNSCSNESCDNP